MSFSCNRSLDGRIPPSPAERRDPQRRSWRHLLHKLLEVKAVSATFLTSSMFVLGSGADLSQLESDSSFFCYPMEETLAAEVVAFITQSLNNAFQVLCCSKLILPDSLLHSISKELLHLAVNEPCGLRGALIDLCVDRGDQGSLCSVSQIAVDPSLVPTFHLTLVLRTESNGLWPKIQKLFKSSKPTSAMSPRHRNTLRLSSGFRAIKRKLYSSGELLIEECC
uniref:DNA damage-inducible transcript 4 protein n=1 Tax=Nothobranchius furzeri TaxID=105023 RepID=A0A8C6MEI8_NOTFU